MISPTSCNSSFLENYESVQHRAVDTSSTKYVVKAWCKELLNITRFANRFYKFFHQPCFASFFTLLLPPNVEGYCKGDLYCNFKNAGNNGNLFLISCFCFHLQFCSSHPLPPNTLFSSKSGWWHHNSSINCGIRQYSIVCSGIRPSGFDLSLTSWENLS